MIRNQVLIIALTCSVMIGCGRDRATESADTARPDTGAVATSGAAEKNKPGLGDKNFVQDVAKANTAEIELGRMAAERAADAQVKTFGQMMVDDHTPAGDKLKVIAADSGIEWPAQLDEKFTGQRDDLAKKQGADFDYDYMTVMVNAHQDLVDKLESRIDKKNLAQWKADKGTKDRNRAPDKTVEKGAKAVEIVPEKSDNPVTARINDWAAAVYPTAYAHLDQAKTLDSAIKRRRTNP